MGLSKILIKKYLTFLVCLEQKKIQENSIFISARIKKYRKVLQNFNSYVHLDQKIQENFTKFQFLCQSGPTIRKNLTKFHFYVIPEQKRCSGNIFHYEIIQFRFQKPPATPKSAQITYISTLTNFPPNSTQKAYQKTTRINDSYNNNAATASELSSCPHSPSGTNQSDCQPGCLRRTVLSVGVPAP
jgi:hypothetical protein